MDGSMPEELNDNEIRLLKLFINKPSVMRMLVDYPKATIKGGLFDSAYKVCKYYNITIEELVGKRRDRELVKARRDFCHLDFKNTNCTKEKIGQFLKRDHTSVIYHLGKEPVNLDKINGQ